MDRSADAYGVYRHICYGDVEDLRTKKKNQLKLPQLLPGPTPGETKYSGIRSFPVKPTFLSKAGWKKKHVGSFIQF